MGTEFVSLWPRFPPSSLLLAWKNSAAQRKALGSCIPVEDPEAASSSWLLITLPRLWWPFGENGRKEYFTLLSLLCEYLMFNKKKSFSKLSKNKK